ncbi:unnamed protein product [Ascophyllum nodosum]
MEVWTAKALSEGDDALSSASDNVDRIGQLLASEFSYTSIKDVERRFKDLLASCDGQATENKDLSALLSTVRDEVTQALNILLALKRWIRVQVPTIEDGNNFGVSVQREVAGAIDELLEPMQKALDKLPGYFEKRASAWDKIATKISKETKKSNSTAKETGGKDGDLSKTSDSSTTEDKTSQGWSAPDSSLHLIAIDVSCFVDLHHMALQARDALIISADMIGKNVKKLQKPKGTNNRGSSMYSF